MPYFDRVAARAVLCLAGVLLVSGCIDGLSVISPVIINGAVQLPCCTSGTPNIVRIDTGSAPWMVRNPSSTYFHPVVSLPPNTMWATVGSSTWVRPFAEAGASATAHPEGVYTYSLQFRVPACASGRTITISGRFAADNTASVFFESPVGPFATLIASQTSRIDGFRAANITTFSKTIASAVPGSYALRFDVTNEQFRFSDTGLTVSGVIATNCSSRQS